MHKPKLSLGDNGNYYAGICSSGGRNYSFIVHNDFAVYFLLFGIAAVFTFAGFSVLPTARNNRKAIMSQDEQARKQMEDYVKGYPDFPVPARYAHPTVLKRMQRVIEQGRAEEKGRHLKLSRKISKH